MKEEKREDDCWDRNRLCVIQIHQNRKNSLCVIKKKLDVLPTNTRISDWQLFIFVLQKKNLVVPL